MTTCTNCSKEWDAQQLGPECPSCGLDLAGSEVAPEASEPPPFTPGIESSGWGAQPSIGEGWSSDPAFEDSDGPEDSSAPSAPPPIQPPPLSYGSSGSSSEPPTPSVISATHDPFQPTQPSAVKTGMSTGGKVGLTLAVGGLVLLLGVIGVVVAVVGAAPDFVEDLEAIAVEEFEDQVTPSPDALDVDEIGLVNLPVGACFDGGSPSSEVPCSQAHEYEVFDSIELESSTYPTWEVAWVQTNCDDEFEAFVGINYFESQLWYEVARPSESAWNLGDHEIRCLVYLPGKLLTGTVRGAAY